MPLRLDPDVPAVWRSPQSLQLGVEPPRVVLDDLSAAEEQVIAVLRSGAPRTVVGRIAEHSGLDASSTDALLRRLAPALLAETPSRIETPTVPIGFTPTDATAERVATGLVEAGLRLEPAHAASALVLLVGRFALEPARYRPCMNADTPHLPIVFGERSIAVGPVVVPGRTPCLYCGDLARTDADPAWPVIASQLTDRPAPTDTPLGAGLAAAISGAIALAYTTTGFTALGTDTLLIEPTTGALQRRPNRWHPDCGCRALPGSDSADAASAAGSPSRRS